MRRTARATAALLLLAAAAPAGALAHGLGAPETLPVPAYIFAWAAAIALVLSFAALGALWPRPRFVDVRSRLVWAPGRWARIGEVVGGALGVAIFALVVYSGLEGRQDAPLRNLAPVAIYVVFWVLTPLASALVGDVFALVSPWRAVSRAVSAVWGRTGGSARPPLAYPERLGRWPAAVGVLAFAWVELVGGSLITPSTLATLAIYYAALQLLGHALFGREAWERNADAFGVYFGLFAAMAPLRWSRDGVYARRPLEGLTRLATPPGTIALLAVMIGTTSFDGLSRSGVWRDAASWLHDVFGSLGAGQGLAVRAADSLGLLVMCLVVLGIYHLGVAGMEEIGERHGPGELGRRFVHSLVPIALAYVVAHYLTLVVYDGQALAYLISDPLGTGANLLGTADAGIDLHLLGASAVWYIQITALLAGHAAGLLLAHERALVSFRRPYDASRSQYWMLSVMIGFTCLGLWLLQSR